MALSLGGPRSPREKVDLRSVVAAARRSGENGQADLGLTLLHFATYRSWWIDPGLEIRSEIAAASRALAPDPGDAGRILLSASRRRTTSTTCWPTSSTARDRRIRQRGRRTATRDGGPLGGRA